MKAALSSGLKTNTMTQQQIRQLSIQQQIIAQHRKIPQQKVAQLGQVCLLNLLVLLQLLLYYIICKHV